MKQMAKIRTNTAPNEMNAPYLLDRCPRLPFQRHLRVSCLQTIPHTQRLHNTTHNTEREHENNTEWVLYIENHQSQTDDNNTESGC
jgi:1-acyl-sn-glycerol-3-phosphate acyltransferase